MSVRRVERRNPAAALDNSPRQRKVLFMHGYLAGFTALQILYLALDDLKLNLALSLGFSTGYIFAYTLPTRWRAVTEYGVSALAVAASFYYAQLWRQDMSLYGNLLGILGGVLMVLLSFRAFTTNAHRFILMFCVVFLLFGAVASYDLKFMLLLPLFLVFAGCALYVANQVDVHAAATGERGGAMPGHGGLTRQFMGVLLRSIGVVLALSVVAYISAPHSAAAPRGLILNKASTVEDPTENDPQQPEENPQSGRSQVGLGEDFDMRGQGELEADPTPMLKVKTHRVGYMREKVYDVFTGSGWEQSRLMQPSGNGPGSLLDLQQIQDLYASGSSGVGYNAPLVDFPSTVTYTRLVKTAGVRVMDGNTFSQNSKEDITYDINQQQVTLLADQPPYYFASYQPFRLTNLSRTESGRILNTPYLDLGSSLRPIDIKRKLPKDFTYTVHSLEPRVSYKALDEVYSAGPDEIVQRYTWLPLATQDWHTQAVARGLDTSTMRPISQRFVNFATTKFGGPALVNGKEIFPSIWDKAKAINDWLASSGEFTYSRQHPPLPDGQEVTEAFCFTTKSGYCRFFASTMAVLCRLNGIPARIVTGYSPGKYSLAENAYLYHGSNAHAWVEVYFDGYGWILFDPTPASQSVYSNPESKQLLGNVLDFLQELFVIDPASTQRTILEGLRMLWQLARDNAGIVAASALLLGAALAGLLAVQRRQRLRRSAAPVQPANAIVAAYLRMQQQLRRLGFVLETGDTARVIVQAAGGYFPALATPLDELLPLYEAAAFSTVPVEPAQEARAQRLTDQIETFVREELERQRQERRKH
jgi:transglutaminase-like putative cysteine protease